MRHNSQRRQRNKGHNGGQNNGARRNSYNRNQIFDSNGPEVRIRGTAFQVCEKYQALAKDAAATGDRVLAESYLQHAEHYQRIISTWNEENKEFSRPQDMYAVEGTQIADQNEDDLSLPVSILGGSVEVISQAVTTDDQQVLESA